MKVFGIAGFKNSGKTTLVVDLIDELTGRDLEVATVKHAHHEFDIDHAGKDSFRHREAGAREVIVASAKRWAHINELTGGPEPTLNELLSHIGDVDLVLIEGYKHGAHPKLELHRGDQDQPLLARSDDSICAIVCDGEIPDAPAQVLDRSDVKGIANFILRQVGL